MSKSCQRQKNVFQIGHFTDTCVIQVCTRVSVRYVSDIGHAIDMACSGFIEYHHI